MALLPTLFPWLPALMTGLARQALEVGGAPAVCHYRGTPEHAAERGTVLFYHGFGGDKAGRVAGYADAIAAAGFLAVCPDAVGHGDRRYPDFEVTFNDARWDADFEATESDFLDLLDASAAEVPAIVDDLLARDYAIPGRIGIGGRSLGGNISYAAVLADSRLRAMVSIMGSPEWTLPRAHSPHHFPDRFFPAAVHAQSAELDEFVPAKPVRDFHDQLVARYGHDAPRLEYVEYPGVGHFLTPQLNADSQQRTVAWFRRWLPADDR
jgi:dienelactone hydrolase